jgi:hypothetical protein
MNRITQFSVVDRSLSPAEAEVWVLADADAITPSTEIRGRLVGPTCPYSTTIEVAYPLRPLPTTVPGLPPLARRVNVPEPSFWDPVAPFLYHGVVELWEDGKCCDRRAFRRGFRDARVESGNVVWNGRPLKLSVVDRADVMEDELPGLRLAGVNALVVPGDAESLWHAAERLGFVVIGRATEPRAEWLELTESPACLGWIVPPEAVSPQRSNWMEHVKRLRRWVGLETEIGLG